MDRESELFMCVCMRLIALIFFFFFFFLGGVLCVHICEYVYMNV